MKLKQTKNNNNNESHTLHTGASKQKYYSSANIVSNFIIVCVSTLVDECLNDDGMMRCVLFGCCQGMMQSRAIMHLLSSFLPTVLVFTLWCVEKLGVGCEAALRASLTLSVQ